MPSHTSIELKETVEFLAAIVPFDKLDENLLNQVANAVEIAYYRRGSSPDLFQPNSPQLFVVRSGAFEVRSIEGDLIDQLDTGGCFGFPSLLTGDEVTNRCHVLEDGLLYHIDEQTFRAIRHGSRNFDRFFNQAHAKRLRHAVRFNPRNSLLTEKVSTLLSSPAITLEPSASAQSAALLMTERRISCLLIVDNNGLCGLVTDRDLRSRLVAKGYSTSINVSKIMSHTPVTINADMMLFEALMVMSEHNIHHLPVMSAASHENPSTLTGILTATDLIKYQRAEPVYLIGEISKLDDRQGLKQVAKGIPKLISNMIERDARAADIGRVVTSMSDAITKQLIHQAIQRFGPPPVAFSWLAFGSQARQEQSAKSDQDNGLLLAEDLKPEDEAYFEKLSEYVCDGLACCGYVHCPGDIMAMNPKWRQTLTAWQEHFFDWIDHPSPKALMHASIFFDMRCISGNLDLFTKLQSSILQRCQGNSIFLACLAKNALQLTPPISFFRKFVLTREGEHKNSFDMKLRGIMPVTDIARIYALDIGSSEVSTLGRLKSVCRSKGLSLKDGRDLADAYEFIAYLRFKHQGRKLAAGETPDNFLKPNQVSGLTRHQLRDAFSVVARSQAGIKLKFTRGLI